LALRAVAKLLFAFVFCRFLRGQRRLGSQPAPTVPRQLQSPLDAQSHEVNSPWDTSILPLPAEIRTWRTGRLPYRLPACAAVATQAL